MKKISPPKIYDLLAAFINTQGLLKRTSEKNRFPC